MKLDRKKIIEKSIAERPRFALGGAQGLLGKTQAIVPAASSRRVRGEKPGLLCTPIIPGSICDKLDLRDDDAIRFLNGHPAKVIRLLASIKDPSTKNFRVSIKRGGGPCTVYSYEIK